MFSWGTHQHRMKYTGTVTVRLNTRKLTLTFRESRLLLWNMSMYNTKRAVHCQHVVQPGLLNKPPQRYSGVTGNTVRAVSSSTSGVHFINHSARDAEKVRSHDYLLTCTKHLSFLIAFNAAGVTEGMGKSTNTLSVRYLAATSWIRCFYSVITQG